MKNHWWRAYNTAANDPKLGELSDWQHRCWFQIMCMASDNDGQLPPLKHIAYTLRVKPEKAAEVISQLHSAGLLDKTDNGFVPHNWNGRQYKSDVSTERVKRFRNAQRNVSCNDERNAPEKIREDKIIEDKKEARVTALDDGWPSDFREQFWNLYPHKIGKADAIAKLERIRKRGVPWAVLMDGLRRYIATKPVDRPWCNPATWLNQARWEDQPAGSVSAQESQAEEGDAFWDAVLTSFKRFGVWSKHAGPDLESPACRVPAAMLAKHGLLRADEINPHQVPRLKSMGGLN